MRLLSPILGQFANGDYAWWCPGCNHAHHVPTNASTGPNWSFNQNPDSPSFSPSVRHFWPAYHDPDHPEDDSPEKTFCHYFITNGNIVFCGDCTHPLSGQTVSMVDLSLHQDYGWPE